jgi:succinate-semialdehyde dehydrogenase / glutarate-semialdehyde dehydrogenase
LKKVTLELGGNCPFIIFDDANLEQAADGMRSTPTVAIISTTDKFLALMLLKWRHAGQACITANRVYVQNGVYNEFAKLISDRTSKLVVGHGAEKSTTMGPVTTPHSIDKVISQVEDAKKKGGRIALGGNKVQDTTGYFFQPTIILDANPKMIITEEETFGPVLALYPFDTEDEAVEAANNTSVCPHPITVPLSTM